VGKTRCQLIGIATVKLLMMNNVTPKRYGGLTPSSSKITINGDQSGDHMSNPDILKMLSDIRDLVEILVLRDVPSALSLPELPPADRRASQSWSRRGHRVAKTEE
jgi:hypothetical protein